MKTRSNVVWGTHSSASTTVQSRQYQLDEKDEETPNEERYRWKALGLAEQNYTGEKKKRESRKLYQDFKVLRRTTVVERKAWKCSTKRDVPGVVLLTAEMQREVASATKKTETN